MKIVPKGPINKSQFGSFNSLTPSRPQVIIWTSDCLVYWHNGWTNTRFTGNSRRHHDHLTSPECTGKDCNNKRHLSVEKLWKTQIYICMYFSTTRLSMYSKCCLTIEYESCLPKPAEVVYNLNAVVHIYLFQFKCYYHIERVNCIVLYWSGY